MNRRLLIGVGFYLGVVAGLWGASQWGLLAAIDGWLYDRLIRASWVGQPPVARTLLVESLDRNSEPSPGNMAVVLQALRDLDAAVIGVIDASSRAGADGFAQPAPAAPLVVARLLRVDPDRAGTFLPVLPPFAAAARAAGLAPPRLEDGIGRLAAVSYPLAQGELPALAWELAKIAVQQGDAPQARELPRTDYLLDFSAATAHLPEVSFERAARAGLVRGLVAGKTVLVAAGDNAAPGVATPRGGEPLSLARYTAVALESLLQGTWIARLPAPWLLGLIAIITAVALPLFLLASPRTAPWLLLALIALVLLLAWAALSWLRNWIPVAAPVLALSAAYLFTARRRSLATAQRLRGLLREGAARLDRTPLPDEFHSTSSPEHWSALSRLATQLLDLKRTVFFEAVPGERVREVHALHCSFEDIRIPHRNLTQPPYSDAVAKNAPIQPRRDLLTPRAGEIQYLAPLAIAGRVLGFWAFTLAPREGMAGTRRLTLAANLGSQLAELLHHRGQWQRQERRGSPSWLLLRLEPPGPTPKGADPIACLHRRLDLLEGVINGTETATVLYDLFGQVLQINHAMSDLLRAAGLAPYDMTVVDLVSALTGRSPEQARRDLSDLILEDKKLVLTISLGGADEVYLLCMRPLGTRPGEKGRPFDLMGILIELLAVHEIREVFRLKDELARQIGVQYRDAMETVLLSCSLMENPRLDAERRGRVLGVMRKKLAQIADFSHRVEALLSADPGMLDSDRYPMSFPEALDAAIAAIEPLTSERGVALRRQQPRLVALVYASPSQLKPLLENLLRLLVRDCVAGGEVSLSVTSDTEGLHLACTNTGLGLPDERLQEYLRGSEELESEELRELRQGVRLVGLWGGELNLHGMVGEGLRAELRLRAFA